MTSNDIMFMNWRSMIKPDKVEVNSTPSYGKFVCEPLERGFGITIGNSLRRIILSSLHGACHVLSQLQLCERDGVGSPQPVHRPARAQGVQPGRRSGDDRGQRAEAG